MKSKKYSRKIVPIRRFVSPFCAVQIIYGKPTPNLREQKLSQKKLRSLRQQRSNKIKYTLIINDDENLETDLWNLRSSSYYSHMLNLSVTHELHQIMFLVVLENGRKVRCLVDNYSRDYYYLMQYLKQ